MNNPRITALLAAVAQFKDAFETIDALLRQISEEAAEACMDIRSAAKHITDPVTLDRLQHEEAIAIEDEMSVGGAQSLWRDIANKVNDLLPSISDRIEEAATDPLCYEEYKRVEAHHSMPKVLPLHVLAARWKREGDELASQFSKDAPTETAGDAFEKLHERGFTASRSEGIPFIFSHFGKIRPVVASGGVSGKQL